MVYRKSSLWGKVFGYTPGEKRIRQRRNAAADAKRSVGRTLWKRRVAQRIDEVHHAISEELGEIGASAGRELYQALLNRGFTQSEIASAVAHLTMEGKIDLSSGRMIVLLQLAK